MRLLVISVLLLIIGGKLFSQDCNDCNDNDKIFLPLSETYDVNKNARYFKGDVGFSSAICDSLFILKLDYITYRDSIMFLDDPFKTMENVINNLIEDNPMGFPPDTSNGQYETKYYWKIMIPTCWKQFPIDTTVVDSTFDVYTSEYKYTYEFMRTMHPCSNSYCCIDLVLVFNELCQRINKSYFRSVVTSSKECDPEDSECFYMCDIQFRFVSN